MNRQSNRFDSLIRNYWNYFKPTTKPIVWEVGAFNGDDCVDVAKRIYSGNIEWFWMNSSLTVVEPIPEMVKQIKKRHHEVNVIEKAASDFVGSAPFMVYDGDDNAIKNSSLNLKWRDGDLGGHQITVDVDKLDNLVKDDEIDVMIIEVNGFPLEVLRGFMDHIRSVKMYYIETEEWTKSNLKIKNFMLEHNYLLIDEVKNKASMPDQVWLRN